MPDADDDVEQVLKRNLLDLIQEAVAGTDWEPTSGGIVTDAVVIMGWADAQGGYGQSFILAGSPYACEGLMLRALRETVDEDVDYET